MSNFDEQGARWDLWAPFYDEDTKNQDAGSCATLLRDLAGAGDALELAVGTGRVAVPLAQRGTPVVGIDASEEMLKRLDQRAAGLPVAGVLADIAHFDLGRKFDLIFIVASSFFLLPSQEMQVACFRSAAAHLADGGKLVLEAAMPIASGLAGPRQQMIVRELSDQHLKFSAFQHDPSTQSVRAQEARFGGPPEEWRLLPNTMRYAYPSEMDLMAQLAGLSLTARWGNWLEGPLTPTSTHHVSTYTSQPRDHR
ncbi:class I SAM-dependent DNA methyltransferase [Streptomyces sp. NPDC091040]|uniref:class I SAM-dependent DNA methyltransferase n=1 Tax=Streptomyces sp. NPDC091040 TaxID=3365972 RepID=UPI00380698CF